MTREHFASLVEHATNRTREYAKEFVVDHLPESSRYYLNISAEYPNRKKSEQSFPEMSMAPREFKGPLTAEALADEIWIDGAVPVWVDLFPYRSDSDFTYFDTIACNRFSSEEEDLYFSEPGVGPSPFGHKSPAFPPDWKMGAERFSLLERVERFGHLRKEIG